MTSTSGHRTVRAFIPIVVIKLHERFRYRGIGFGGGKKFWGFPPPTKSASTSQHPQTGLNALKRLGPPETCITRRALPWVGRYRPHRYVNPVNLGFLMRSWSVRSGEALICTDMLRHCASSVTLDFGCDGPRHRCSGKTARVERYGSRASIASKQPWQLLHNRRGD